MRALRAPGIDYPASGAARFSRRLAARAFCESAKFAHPEDVFLAGLLQDMAVLALDRVSRDFYSKLPQPATHAHWISYETERLGRDHADYSALLLKTWNLPERICKAVEGSHAPQTFSAATDEGKFARCVALGSDLAEAVLTTERAAAVGALAQRAHRLLGMSHEQFNEVVARVLSLIPETEELYGASIIAADEADNLLSEARELLAVRNLHALQEVSTLQATTSVLLARTEEAEDSSRRDPLTGALNRPWLDRLLDREFTQAVVFGRDLSVAHVDIDRFKTINERYSAQVGDKVLQSCARALLAACAAAISSHATAARSSWWFCRARIARSPDRSPSACSRSSRPWITILRRVRCASRPQSALRPTRRATLLQHVGAA